MGYASKVTAYSLAGFFIIFFLGAVIILPNNLTVKTGEYTSTYYKFGNNFTDSYHWDYAGTEPAFNPSDLNDPQTVFLFHEYNNVTGIYDPPEYDNSLIGWLMSFIGVAGMTISWFEYRSDRREVNND